MILLVSETMIIEELERNWMTMIVHKGETMHNFYIYYTDLGHYSTHLLVDPEPPDWVWCLQVCIMSFQELVSEYPCGPLWNIDDKNVKEY